MTRMAATARMGEVGVEGVGRPKPGLRLAAASGMLRGPEKYRQLDLRRRRAQILARRVLGLR
jgi:hypothetical protein